MMIFLSQNYFQNKKNLLHRICEKVPYSIIGFSTQFSHDKIDKEDEKQFVIKISFKKIANFEKSIHRPTHFKRNVKRAIHLLVPHPWG